MRPEAPVAGASFVAWERWWPDEQRAPGVRSIRGRANRATDSEHPDPTDLPQAPRLSALGLRPLRM